MLKTNDQTDGFTFAVSLHDSERIIGVAGLNRYDHLSYFFHPEFWGQGYCTEAVCGFLGYLFKQQNERKDISASVYEDNLGSRRVLEKCGFVIQVYSRNKEEQDEYSSRKILPKEEEDNLRLAIGELFKITGQKSKFTQNRREMLLYSYETLNGT